MLSLFFFYFSFYYSLLDSGNYSSSRYDYNNKAGIGQLRRDKIEMKLRMKLKNLSKKSKIIKD